MRHVPPQIPLRHPLHHSRLHPSSPLASLPQSVPTPGITEQEQKEQMQQCNIQAVKNALYRHKEEPLVPENESLDLVQWWDVKLTFLCVKLYNARVELLHDRNMKWPTRFLFLLRSMFFQYRYLQFLVNRFSHLARRHVHYDAVFIWHQCWRFSRC